MKVRVRVIVAIGLLGLVPVPLFSQNPAVKPAFDVVSIKISKPGPPQGTTVGARGSTFSAINATLRMLLEFAYQPGDGALLHYRLIGGPNWIDNDRFDVLAKLEGDARSMPYERIQQMVQSLLEDRFQLHVHREVRDLPVYNLVVAKSGLKMKLSDDQTPPNPPGGIRFDTSTDVLARGWTRVGTNASTMVVTGNAVPLSRLLPVLQNRLDRKLIDATNLKGLYDFDVRFTTPDATTQPTEESAASLFTAVEELGLKVESAKAPLEVVVIDSVQRPTEN